MKLQLKQIRWKRLSLANIYIISLVATIFLLLVWKGELLVQTKLFDEISINAIKGQTVNGKALFFYVLKDKIVMIAVLFLMATTSLGNIFVYMSVLWYGVCSGLIFTVALLHYGLKGILLLVGGMFPHYLIYVPAIILTLQLSREKKVVNGKYCLQFLVILLVVITGCLLECYVNPGVVAKLLKNF